MTEQSTITTGIFDGHNDLLLKLWERGGHKDRAAACDSFTRGLSTAIDGPKAQRGGFIGGFFAVFVPSPADLNDMFARMSAPAYDLPLPSPLPWESAIKVTLEQIAILQALEDHGALRICRSLSDITAATTEGQIAAILHLEGAEAIATDLSTLDVLYAAGLRSLGPVWSRATDFGHGVPFRFPSTGDIGPGLTDHGKALLRRCNQLGVMVDLSHLNEAGFWDVARLSRAPLVATHSNAHALCPHARNLTDAQLRAIGESGGMVGLNFATAFLRPDGQMRADTPIALLLAHLHHMIALAGEECVGLGSDYDGALVPEALRTVADLPALTAAMAAHGYSSARIEKLCHRNWLRVLGRSWVS